MIRRPPRSTQSRSSAASDVYKRQDGNLSIHLTKLENVKYIIIKKDFKDNKPRTRYSSVSYTHLRAHETVLDLVCRLLLEKKKKNNLILS